jgi:hypothetical protein
MPASFTFPLSCWMGLAIGADELAGRGYARQPVTYQLTADGYSASSATTVQWPEAVTNPWGRIDTVTLWDSAVGGNQIGTGLAITPVYIDLYDRARVQAGGFTVVPISHPFGFGLGGFGLNRYATVQDLEPIGSGIGSPYGVGPYGVGPYAALEQGVMLERTFDTAQHVCQPGTWAPGPFAVV